MKHGRRVPLAWFLTAMVVALVGGTLPALAQQGTVEPSKAQRYYLRGVDFMNGLQYLDAVEQFRLAIDEDPQFVDAYRRLAQAYTHIGRTDPDVYQDALDTYETLQGLLPEEDLDIKRSVASVQAAMGDLALAIETSEEILEVTPQDCALWLQVGDANRELSVRIKADKGAEDPEVTARMDRSVAAYEKVTEVCPDSLSAYNKLGEIYFGSGKFTEAAVVYEKLLARDANALDVASRLGFLYYKGEAWDKAIPVYQQLLEKAPERQEDRKIYSTCLQKAKQYEKAAEQFQFLIDADKEKNKGLYCNKAFLYIDAGNGEKAIETAMQGLAANSPKTGCLNCAWGKGLELRGETLLQGNQFDRSISTYGEAKVKFTSAMTDAEFGSYATKQLARIDQLVERAKQTKMKYEQENPKKAGGKE